MTCLIVDDNPMARLALRNMVHQVDSLQLAGECETALEAFNLMRQTPVDLLLLDIEMPGMSGLELLESLDEPPVVILVTSKENYAVQGFQLHVADYIVKPASFPRFLNAVQHAQEVWKNRKKAGEAGGERFLFVRSGNSFIRIDYENILYAQALGDYVAIMVGEKKVPVHITMKQLEEKLPPAAFARVHRSWIVAISKVDRLEDNAITIRQQIVPLSESYRVAFMKKMNVL